MTDSTWLDEDTLGESLDENAARGGSLSPSGRKAAIGHALPLVGRYFQSQGSPSSLRGADSIGRGDEPLSSDARLIAGLRLRAALATSDRLLSVLEEIGRRPTFRYSLAQAESVGQLQGTLDIARYVMRSPIGEGPPAYPAIDVRRSSETPENVMCAYAILWLCQETTQALDASDATAGSPESISAVDFLERFEAVLASPAFGEGRDAARSALVRGTEDQLMERVEERLRRGEVGNPEPYADLLSLLIDLRRNGPTGEAGVDQWSFYDEAFDARLFELWCLYRLGGAVSEALSVERPSVMSDWTGGGLTFRWSRPVGTVELHYQRSLTTTSDAQPRWTRPGSGKTLRGMPDFIVTARTHAGEERVALLDAKLRQRSGPPTEELYKVLGYFNNFGLDRAARGAILYHAPQEHQPLLYTYKDAASSGVLMATALNPSNEVQVVQGLKPVADMVVGLLGLPPVASRDESSRLGHIEGVIRQRLTELEAIAVTLSPQTLDASKKRLKAALGDPCWTNLDNDAQKMVATAEHVGFFLESDADFSGPVLGLLSPLEAILQKRVIEPAKAAHPEVPGFQRVLTLGNTLGMIKHAVEGNDGPASAALREVLDASQIPYPRLRAAVDVMWNLNVDYRRPAAHKATLSEQQWLDVYGEVVVGQALLGEVVDLLCSSGDCPVFG